MMVLLAILFCAFLTFSDGKVIEKRQIQPRINGTFTGFNGTFPGGMPIDPGFGNFSNVDIYKNCPSAQQCERSADRADECYFRFMYEQDETPQERRLNAELDRLYAECYPMPDYSQYPEYPEYVGFPSTPAPRNVGRGFGSFSTSATSRPNSFNNFFSTPSPRGKRQVTFTQDGEDMKLDQEISEMIMAKRSNCEQMAIRANCIQTKACVKQIEGIHAQLSKIRAQGLRKVRDCVRQALNSNTGRNNAQFRG